MATEFRRRLLAALVVALLVATAGCSGLFGGDGGTGVDEETPVDGDNSTADTNESDGGTATPAGYEPSGDALDGAQLRNRTATTIERAGSYTAAQSVTQTSQRANRSYRVHSATTFWVDFDAGVGIRTRNRTTQLGSQVREETLAVYTDGNTSYAKATGPRGTNYASTSVGADDGVTIQHVNTTGVDQSLAAFVDAFEWSRVGTETVDGVGMARYNATAVANATLVLGEVGTLHSANATLLVAADGTIRQRRLVADYTRDGTRTTAELELVLSDIGETTVAEPDWLAAAKST